MNLTILTVNLRLADDSGLFELLILHIHHGHLLRLRLHQVLAHLRRVHGVDHWSRLVHIETLH